MEEITEAFVRQIERKIEEKGNGDIDEMVLALVWATYQKVDHIEANPAIRLGSIVKENKGLTAFILFIAYLLTVVIPELLLKLLGFDPAKLVP